MKKYVFQLMVLLMLVSTAFFSCKKTVDKINPDLSAKIDAAFPESDNAVIIMPDFDVSGVFRTDGNDEKYNTFYGPQVQMGNGHIRSWINITHGGKPLAIGVEMTDGSLANLNSMGTFTLRLHQKANNVTPFDHITLNWNMRGHEPPHVYDVPHFDFHFYKISVADQMAIPPYIVAPAKFNHNPPAGYMPSLYLNPGGGVPMMGAHWIDLLSPEVQPPASPNHAAFTHTFIYGSYDGAVTFVEPMITHALLNAGTMVHKWYRQPLYFSPTGTNYPQRYNIWKDASNGRHYVSLDQMLMR